MPIAISKLINLNQDEKYKCAKFRYCRICLTDIRQGGPFRPIRESPEKVHPE